MVIDIVVSSIHVIMLLLHSINTDLHFITSSSSSNTIITITSTAQITKRAILEGVGSEAITEGLRGPGKM